MPTKSPFEVVVLNKGEYRSLYEQAFIKPQYTKAFTERMHKAEFQKLDRALHRAFASRWKEREDFGMMDGDPDFGEAFNAWHHCGGIYTNRICCPAYVEGVIQAIACLPHALNWTYHTACELYLYEKNPVLSGTGEFFIRSGKLFAPIDGNDYARIFQNRA